MLCRVAVTFAILTLFPVESFAAKKKNTSGSVTVQATDIFTVGVSIKIGKRKSTHDIACFNGKAGKVSTTSKGLSFSTLAQQLEKLRKKGGSATKQATLRELISKTTRTCADPDFLSLKRYKGKFGAEQARVIYEKFAFGASPAEIDEAVSLGLTGLVARLTTRVDDSQVDSYESQIRCDGKYPTDATRKTCDSLNPNDIYFEGVNFGLVYRMRYTNNPFFERLFLFLHEERLSAAGAAVGGGESHAYPKHVDMIRRAAYSGDYRQYMRDWNEDLLGNLKYLDGGLNHGINPNENYAREFWQLGTIGPWNLDGVPNYNEDDIIDASLAFSGQFVNCENRKNSLNQNFSYCYTSFAQDRHYPYVYRDPQIYPLPVVFRGTRYQATVRDANELLEATFQTPWVAEDLARELWLNYVNSTPTKKALRNLAKIIQDKNHNLVDALRILMTSRAALAQKSRKSIIKTPAELVFGFLRTSGLPLPASSGNYSTLNTYFSNMGQIIMTPPSIFGYDTSSLAGSQKVLAWRNAALAFIQRDPAQLAQRGYRFQDQFLGGLSGVNDSVETVDRLAANFNIPLTAAQRERLAHYMDYQYVNCPQNQNGCNGQPYIPQRKEFDSHPDAEPTYQLEKLRGAIGILIMQPEYRLK